MRLTRSESIKRWNSVAMKQKRAARLEQQMSSRKENLRSRRESRPKALSPYNALVKDAHDRGWLLASELAKKYDRGPSGIQSAMSRGDLKYHQVGRARMVEPEVFEEYMRVKDKEKRERCSALRKKYDAGRGPKKKSRSPS